MMYRFIYWMGVLLTVMVIMASCAQHRTNALFTSLDPDVSGIHFSNDIRENDSSHSFINEFGYMGGGVGIGDFNNDGLKDIFFTGNQVSCRLYLNKGQNKFEDITQSAGITTNEWATGVSIADVNHDGYDDIYVCVFGKNLTERGKNLLFINQHNLTFREEAASYGLADTGYSTQAAFLDYDRDGDLDMYLTNYRLNGPNANYLVPRDSSGRSPANDRLYRNDGFNAALGHDVFTDVSIEAGIKDDGYGLGVTVSDFNSDGWPDIYVANDFVSNDLLWLNNQHGGFFNAIAKSIRHQSYSSMGTDAADINNDGLVDIVTLDMLPEYNERKKQSFFFMNYERYQSERSLGYEPEFPRNMLQLNRGNRNGLPLFSEIGQLAGISATDWSWSILMADFNNDGWKDMHITNGIGRDFINGDFLEFSSNAFASNGTPEQHRAAVNQQLSTLKPVTLNNYLYLNKQDNVFQNIADSAGIATPSLSNGAAYADLDNDGDLDLVVNNINQPAFVFINNSRQASPGTSHYIKFKLLGDTANRRGFGTSLKIYCHGQQQMQEQYPVRGYFSTVDADLVFGLGGQTTVDSLLVIWPDQKREWFRSLGADSTYLLFWKKAATLSGPANDSSQSFFTDVSGTTSIAYKHLENIYNDFGTQRLLPQKFSQLGPFISTADINGDGITDFFVGNGISVSGHLIKQLPDGRFASTLLSDSAKMEEDADCIFFDADSDGDQDLIITGGDVQYTEHSPYYCPRLYLNDGRGHFKLAPGAIPAAVTSIAGCVRAADFDNDGDADLFIGGRVSHNYPQSPQSYLLRNDKGHFTDVTALVCPALQHAGMITSAAWLDLNADKLPDLVIAGEWMPVRFFRNDGARLLEVTAETGLQEMNGMWRSLAVADLDNDGDADIVAGNLGLNCVYEASAAMPMQLLAADIDGNGTIDPVLFYYILDKDAVKRQYPAISRSQFAEQVPLVKKQFLHYKAYAHATAADIFKGNAAKNLLSFTCNETRTCWLENKGHGIFEKHVLPMAAQFAPVNAILAGDINCDDYPDLVLAGNEYQADIMIGRYDASYGTVLLGSKEKNFTALSIQQSGLALRGDIKSMTWLPTTAGGRLLVAAANNDSLQIYRLKTSTRIR